MYTVVLILQMGHKHNIRCVGGEQNSSVQEVIVHVIYVGVTCKIDLRF